MRELPPFDRSLYDKMEIDWAQPFLVSVDTKSTNLLSHVSGLVTVTATNFYGLAEKCARIDSSMPIYITLNSNTTIADIDNLITIATNAGIEGYKTLLEVEPIFTNEWALPAYREIQISPPRSIY